MLGFALQVYQQAAIDLINDSESCPSVTTTATKCATSSTDDGGAISYYSEFEYANYRVIVSSGIPNHVAENNTGKNPNWRCKCFN